MKLELNLLSEYFMCSFVVQLNNLNLFVSYLS